MLQDDDLKHVSHVLMDVLTYIRRFSPDEEEAQKSQLEAKMKLNLERPVLEKYRRCREERAVLIQLYGYSPQEAE